MPVDVIVAAGLECLHQSALTSVAGGDDGQVRILWIRMDDLGNFQRTHLAHIGGAHNGRRGVIFQRGQGKCCLGGGGHLKTLALQRIAEAFCKQHVAVDQQNSCGLARNDHACASGIGAGPSWLAPASAPGISAFKWSTSITSPPCDSHPATWGESETPAGVNSALINSQSPLTGRAIQSSVPPWRRVAIR